MRTFNMTQWTNCQSRNALVQCTCRPNVSYSLIFRASYLVDAKWNPPEIKEEKREYFRHLVTPPT